MKRIIIFIGLFIPFLSTAQRFAQFQKLFPDPYLQASEDQFGYSVAVYGDHVVIGEPGYDNYRGRATLYYAKDGKMKRLSTFLPKEPVVGGRFGYSVAIYGDTVVVGAPYDSEGSYHCGAVYLFGKSSGEWCDMTETIKLLPPDAGYEKRFGWSVAVDARFLAVGSPGWDPTVEGDKASVYLYRKENTWTPEMTATRLFASDGEYNDRLGSSLALWENILVVGDPMKNSRRGQVYLYELPVVGELPTTETARLMGEGLEINDHFGDKVAVHGNTIVAGMYASSSTWKPGKAFVFVKPGRAWTDMTPTAVLTPSDPEGGDLFGRSVAIYMDTIVVSSVNGPNHGAVYIFHKPSTGWQDKTEDAVALPNDREAGNYFGLSLALGGTEILVGAPAYDEVGDNSGSVYLFDWSIDDKTPVRQVAQVFPEPYLTSQKARFSSDIDICGDYAVVGEKGYDHSRGRAYVLHYENGSWRKMAVLTASDGTAGDEFGASVALSGHTVVVGAPAHNVEEGVVYLFEEPDGGWTDMTETAVLTVTDGSRLDRLGEDVAVEGDTVVAGAPGYDGGGVSRGGVFLFVRPAAGWSDMTETARLLASDGAGGDLFGKHVAFGHGLVVAGAEEDDDQGDASGSAYLFERPAGGWTDMTETARLTASDGAAGDHFGGAVAVDSALVVIGASSDDDLGSNSGSVYLFERPAGGWTDMTETDKLTAPDGESGDLFGGAVAILKDTLVVGAVRHGIYPNEGTVYVFSRSEEGWTTDLVSDRYWIYPRPYKLVEYGSAVALSHRFLMVAAPMEVEQSYDGGAVFFYIRYDPVILIRQPQDLESICPDDTVSFVVEAENARDYYWMISTDGGVTYRDLPVWPSQPWRSTDTLWVTTRVDQDSIWYRCRVMNPSYVVYSDPVLLSLDTVAPVLEVHDTSVVLNDEGEAGLNPWDVVTSVTDNCSGVNFGVSPADFSTADTGEVEVNVVAVDRCENVTVKTVTVTVLMPTAREDLPAGELVLRPNPARNSIRVLYDGRPVERLEIRDLAGRLLLLQEHPGEETDISRLEKGVYVVRIVANGKKFVMKIVKE